GPAMALSPRGADPAPGPAAETCFQGIARAIRSGGDPPAIGVLPPTQDDARRVGRATAPGPLGAPRRPGRLPQRRHPLAWSELPEGAIARRRPDVPRRLGRPRGPRTGAGGLPLRQAPAGRSLRLDLRRSSND